MKLPYVFAEIISEFHEIQHLSKNSLKSKNVPKKSDDRKHSTMIQVGVDQVPVIEQPEENLRRKSAPDQILEHQNSIQNLRPRSASVSYRILK
ncbi:unnamed protein product [Caenorhabditis angaria]|uniref:Uncharacterized protein n=1 Tax=Caenorhabditis angaria TaxID=860376 RepID=A0A9P1N411_9PELO|nr:unnamed protein product [Caenorhabditis angaria]